MIIVKGRLTNESVESRMGLSVLRVLFILSALSLATSRWCHAQYQVNGAASQTSCNCFQLTPDQQYLGGSVWNVNQINLNTPFTYTFDVYLGCVDDWTADGIAFVLQPVSVNAGSAGGNLGYGGISPSLVVEIDVFENSGGTVNDPAVIDHIAIMQNGDTDHNGPNNLAGPVQASSTSANIEDCGWHTVQIIWQPGANTLAVFFDGVFRTSYTGNIIASIFGGNPNVYWGWTAATGSLSQDQRFCNAIIPQFSWTGNICEDVATTLNNTTVTATGNIASYQWNFGDGGVSNQANPSHTWANPGTYNVTLAVTTEGCTEDTIIPVTVYATPNVALGADVSVCNGNNIQLNNPNTLGTGTYLWSPAAGLSNANIASPVATPAATTTYTLSFTNNNGCTDTDDIVVTLTFPPNVSAGNDAAICEGSSTPLQATGGVSYAWSPAAGLSATNVANPTASPTVTTLYTVVVTDAANCSATDAVNITVNAAPSISAGADQTICEGFSTSLAGVGTGTVVWSPATGLTDPNILNPVASPIATTTYTATLTDANGCSATDDMLLTVTPTPVASFTANIACSGNPTQFTSTSTGTIALYNWDFGDGTAGVGANPQQTYANVGFYDVILTVTSPGGCGDTYQAQVEVTSGPTAAFAFQGGAQSCEGQVVSFVNNSTGPIANHMWDFGENAPAPSTTSVMQSPTFTYLNAGTYTVNLVVGTADGCINTTQQQLTVNPTPVAAFNAPSGCQGLPLQLMDLSTISSGNITQWEWDFGDSSPIGGTQSPNHTYTQSGAFATELVVTSDMGCRDTTTGNVQVNVTPTVAITAAEACEGDVTAITNSTLPNDGSITQWSWDYGDAATSAAQVQDHTYAGYGTYNITLSATTASGCTANGSTQATVHPYPVPAFVLSDTAGCQPYEVTITNQTSIPVGTISSVSWDFGDGTTGDISDVFAHNYMDDGLFTITLTAVAQGGGCTSTVTMTDAVHVYVTPVADFSFTPTDATMMDPRIRFFDESTDAVEYSWQFGDGNIDDVPSPMHEYQTDGTYPVTLIVTNGPCNSTATGEVIIKPEAAFYVPNAFTPDGNKDNERFQVKGMGLSEIQIQIFDRWGELLFFTNDNEHGWDGYYEGKPVQAGVYNYRINVIDVLGRAHEKIGRVQVLH